jgi:hypothetical protein
MKIYFDGAQEWINVTYQILNILKIMIAWFQI